MAVGDRQNFLGEGPLEATTTTGRAVLAGAAALPAAALPLMATAADPARP